MNLRAKCVNTNCGAFGSKNLWPCCSSQVTARPTTALSARSAAN